MKKKHLDQLHDIHNNLCEIQLEIQGYAALLSSVYEEECISGDDLLGPGMALGRKAKVLRAICQKLDQLGIELYKAIKK